MGCKPVTPRTTVGGVDLPAALPRGRGQFAQDAGPEQMEAQ